MAPVTKTPTPQPRGTRKARPGGESETEAKSARAPHWQQPGMMPDDDPYAPDSVAVYRLYNVAGALLYVGISGSPKVRFGQHAHSKPWWPEVAWWSVTWWASKVAAEAEELRAIREERPAFNILGAPDPGDERDVKGEWLDRFRSRRPVQADLDALFLAVMRSRSVDPDLTPRQRWDPDEALEVYAYAIREARPWHVWAHEELFKGWAAMQTERIRLHRREPNTDQPPVWSRWTRLKATARAVTRDLGFVTPPPRVRPANPDGIECTATGRLMDVCDCNTRHVIDAEESQHFERPVGHPIGRPLRAR